MALQGNSLAGKHSQSLIFFHYQQTLTSSMLRTTWKTSDQIQIQTT